MSFYTSVNRHMNQILYRGYNDSGAPIQSKVKFQPTLYIKSNDESPLRALDGTPVSPVKFVAVLSSVNLPFFM